MEIESLTEIENFGSKVVFSGIISLINGDKLDIKALVHELKEDGSKGVYLGLVVLQRPLTKDYKFTPEELLKSTKDLLVAKYRMKLKDFKIKQ